MAERWKSQREAETSRYSGDSGDDSPRFGWSPHDSAPPSLQNDAPKRSGYPTEQREYHPELYGPTPHRFGVQSASTLLVDEIPEYRTSSVATKPRIKEQITIPRQPPRSEMTDLADPVPAYRTNTAGTVSPKIERVHALRSKSEAIYRRLPHVLILMIAVVIVLSGGFWDRGQPALIPGGTDMIQSVSSPLFSGTSPSLPSTRGLVASAPDNALDGYFTTSSLSVTPLHLGIDTYVASEGQTIADIASEIGLSEDTLLWANDYRDPMQLLSEGTQLRIPPTDGMLHLVSDSDTLENIAERYGVTVEAITGFEPNAVEHSADLVPNRMIMIPGGSMPMRDEVIFYTVREGDALWQIADRFGLESRTILWANSLSNAEMIEPGQQLAILPTDGVMVEVADGDTVESLAETWGVDSSSIRDWPANGLGADGSLIPGQSVMIPGGSPPGSTVPQDQSPAVAEDSAPAAQPVQASQPARGPQTTSTPARGTGTFVWPTTGVITQYFHSAHNGWDIANRMYTNIWAADSGTVIFSGWNNYGLGYAVGIDHGNGFVTWYGHMAEHPPVRVGQWVNQGQYIGPMGSTGFSTGPHVHFVIAYNGVYQDPGNFLR